MKHLRPRILKTEAKKAFPTYFGLQVCAETNGEILSFDLVGDIIAVDRAKYFQIIPVATERDAIRQSSYLLKYERNSALIGAVEGNSARVCIRANACRFQDDAGFLKIRGVESEYFGEFAEFMHGIDSTFWKEVEKRPDMSNALSSTSRRNSTIYVSEAIGRPKQSRRTVVAIIGTAVDSGGGGASWVMEVTRIDGAFRVTRLDQAIE